MLELQEYEPAEELFKVLASAKRLSILHVLGRKEMTAGEIARTIRVRKSNLSQHLAVLRYARLVKARRSATTVYYKVVDPKILSSCTDIEHFAKERKS